MEPTVTAPRIHHARPASGFSLIELMIALAAGLVVVGAVLAFTLSSLRSNADYIGATRLTQELRTTLGFVMDELQRAGYDENALDFVSQPVAGALSSNFGTMQVADSDADGVKECIVYAYDRSTGTAGQVDLASAEIRAIRRRVRSVNGSDVGVVEFAESTAAVTPSCGAAGPDYATYPATCNAGTTWCALSDPRILDVDRLAFDDSEFVPINGIVASGQSGMQIRRIGIEIIGQLQDVDDVRRGLRSEVRIRADCVRVNPAVNCTVAPTGV